MNIFIRTMKIFRGTERRFLNKDFVFDECMKITLQVYKLFLTSRS